MSVRRYIAISIYRCIARFLLTRMLDTEWIKPVRCALAHDAFVGLPFAAAATSQIFVPTAWNSSSQRCCTAIGILVIGKVIKLVLPVIKTQKLG